MRVLVVDPRRAVRLILRGGLRRGGHTVLEATDGIEGIQLVRLHGPDLVVSGWDLPSASGLDLLRTLRATGDTTPVALISPSDGALDPDASRDAEAYGAAFVLTSPMGIEAALEAALTVA